MSSPRFSDSYAPSLTPPCRVENATSYGPGASQRSSGTVIAAVPAARSSRRAARVQRRIVDHGVEQGVERTAECRALRVAELEQVAPVHGEVVEPVRLRALLLEQPTQPCRRLELVRRDLLPAQVGLLVRDEVERELVAVLAQEAACEELVDVIERKRVSAHEPRDVRAQPRRIAQPRREPGS